MLLIIRLTNISHNRFLLAGWASSWDGWWSLIWANFNYFSNSFTTSCSATLSSLADESWGRTLTVSSDLGARCFLPGQTVICQWTCEPPLCCTADKTLVLLHIYNEWGLGPINGLQGNSTDMHKPLLLRCFMFYQEVVIFSPLLPQSCARRLFTFFKGDFRLTVVCPYQGK